MNQTCRVCGEVAAGYHFGAFTCEGCKSFFGRTYNNRSSIGDCKNNNSCVINKKNRTSCKSCRLKKCFTVGMSKSGSRYGRRSNWFKIHCLLQDQQQHQQQHQQHQAVSLASQLASQQQQPLGPCDLSASSAAASSPTTTNNTNNSINAQVSGLALGGGPNPAGSALGAYIAQANQQQTGPNPFASQQQQQQAVAAAAAAGFVSANQLGPGAAAAAGAAGLPEPADSQLYQSALAQILFYYMISQQQQAQQI